MELREATDADLNAIRRVAEASLDASYSDDLGEDAVYRLTEEWYARERVADRLDDDNVVYVVAEDRNDGIVGFSEVEITDPTHAVGEIQWLHVDPAHRGRGVGHELLEYTEERITERGITQVDSVVLDANEGGNTFYRENGYVRVGDQSVEIGGRNYTENTYSKHWDADGPVNATEARDDDGREVFVAFDERERGSLAPFYVVYADEARETPYGYYCGNCDSLDNAMNAMERIECNECGNHRKPSRWDAAYL